MSNSTGKGGFEKGRSGNAGGRPKAVAPLQLAARTHMREMLKVLVKNAKAGNNTAARIVLEFGFGRPTQSVEMRIDESLLHKKISEMTPDELRAFEARLVEMGVGEEPGQSHQTEMFGGDDYGPH
jgi:hypothetical protein